MTSEMPAPTLSAEIFKQLDEYPWDKDKEFQGGLAAILGPNPQPSQINDLTIRAQCFYLSRKRNIPIDFAAYKEHLLSQSDQEDTNSKSSNITNQEPTMSISKENLDNHSSTNAAIPPYQQSQNYPATSSNTQAPTSQTSSNPPNVSGGPFNAGGAPYPKSFAEIVELIQSGKPIPGLKTIVTVDRPENRSKPVLPKRRKPWEKDVPQDQIDGKIGGVFGDERDHYIRQELPE